MFTYILTVGATNALVDYFSGVTLEQAGVLGAISGVIYWVTSYVAAMIKPLLPGGLLGGIEGGAIQLGDIVLNALIFTMISHLTPGIYRTNRTMFQTFIYQVIIQLVAQGLVEYEEGFSL
jgi:uncharacterized membrane protein YvlD (DUF360 family)